MAKVIWSKVALEDLRFIHDYISKDSAFYADKLIEKIITRIEQIETFPSQGE